MYKFWGAGGILTIQYCIVFFLQINFLIQKLFLQEFYLINLSRKFAISTQPTDSF